MQRYYLFAYSNYYPEGGMNDCVLKTNDLAEALERGKLEWEAGNYNHIWDVVKNERVEETP